MSGLFIYGIPRFGVRAERLVTCGEESMDRNKYSVLVMWRFEENPRS